MRRRRMSFTEKINALELNQSVSYRNPKTRFSVEVTRTGKEIYTVTVKHSDWLVTMHRVDRFDDGTSIIGMFNRGEYIGYVSKYMVGIE